MAEDDEKSRLDHFRHSLETSLTARFALRFHAALIIVWTVTVTWLIDSLLLSAQVGMLARFPLCIAVGYLAFLWAVWVWLEYSGIRQYLKREKVDELLKPAPVKQGDSSLLDALDLPIQPPGVESEGCLVLIGLFIAFGATLFFLGIFAPPFFAEVVLEMILGAGLLRGLKKAEDGHWASGVWRTTRHFLALLLVVAMVFAAWAKIARPGAMTMAEAISAEVTKR